MKNKPTEIEIKAINALDSLLENKYALQPKDLIIHGHGYLFSFKLSNGDEYLVKVYDDNSKPKIFKMIDNIN